VTIRGELLGNEGKECAERGIHQQGIQSVCAERIKGGGEKRCSWRQAKPRELSWGEASERIDVGRRCRVF
jgi:hypothetical protein